MKTLDEAKAEYAKRFHFEDWDSLIAVHGLTEEHMHWYYQEAVKTVIDSLDRWRPIDTAPMDGTPVDVWCGNDEFPNRFTDVEYRFPTDGEWWVHGSEEIHEKYSDKMWISHIAGPLIGKSEPTHWMPLPEPPKS